MADMFTPMVARNPNTTNYAVPMWNEAASHLKYDVNPQNDPFGFRQSGVALSGALGSALQTAHPDWQWQRDEADNIKPTGVFFDPYAGPDSLSKYNMADLTKNNSSLASLYSDYTNKFNQWKSQQTSPTLDSQIRQFAGSYKDLPNLGVGGAESAINRINSNMSRYGISDLNQIGSRAGANGKTEFYNNLTGQVLPDQFGHFKSNHQGTLRVKLGTDPNTGKTILTNDWTSPKNQFGDYAGNVVLGSLLALAGGAAYGALSGGSGTAAGAGAGEAAAAGSGEAAAAGSAGTYAPVAEASWAAPSTGGTASGYSAGQLGSGLSSAGSSFGGGLGDVFGTAGTGMSGGTAIGTGIGELGSGTSFLGGMAPIEGLGTASTAGSGLLGNLKNIYDGASTASKVYNAATGGGGTGSGTGTTQGGTGGMMTNANVLPLLAALYGQNNNTPDKLQEIARAALERGDPFGPQRAGYATKLAETYTDPQKVYDENYGALDKTFFNEMMAQDAARGRATDAYKRGTEREAKFQDWMNNYRGQLGGFAGANIDPSRMAGEYLGSMSTAALLNNYNNQAPIQALGSLFGSGNGSGGLSLNDLISGGKSLYNTGSDLWDWGSSFFGE